MNVRAWFKARRQRKARKRYEREKAREAFKHDESPEARQLKNLQRDQWGNGGD